MALETGGEFTFSWQIIMNDLLNLKSGHALQGPIVEAGKLGNTRNTKWSLKLSLRKIDGQYVCYLQRHDTDQSNILFIAVTFKLELLDSRGIIVKSVVKKNSFSIGSFESIPNLLSPECLQRLTYNGKMRATDSFSLRCHIIDEGYKKQTMLWDVPTIIHTQWKIKTKDFENWPKKIKVPLHEYTHIDITMSASHDAIIIRVDKVDLPQAYELKIVAFDYKNTEIDLKDSRNVLQSSHKDRSMHIQFVKNDLLDKSGFDLEYSFTLMCVVSFSDGNSSLEGQKYSIGDPTDQNLTSETTSMPPLQEDLKGLLLNEKYSDVKFRVDNEIIPTHKCILSARSPVFSTMFDQDMLENQTGIVDIPDIDIVTLRSFLEFLYTDTITSTEWDDVLKLLIVADKYQVNILKYRCSNLLWSKLTVENVCEVISVADMVNHSSLKLCAINFLRDNKKQVIPSPVWTDWVEKNTKLAVEILSKLIFD